jgi:hypothetical protein
MRVEEFESVFKALHDKHSRYKQFKSEMYNIQYTVNPTLQFDDNQPEEYE